MQDIFARCLRKNIAQVCTLLKWCTNVKRNFNRIPTLLQALPKNSHPKSTVVTLLMQRRIPVATSSLFDLFPCTYMSRNYACNNRCLFFRRLKIIHEPHEFRLDPGTVANRYNPKANFLSNLL